MSRGLSLLAVAAVLVGSAGLAALVIGWAGAALQLVLGVGLLGLGAGLTALRLAASGDFLRRHFGGPGAAEVRRLGRGGWAGVVLGSAMLGLHYADRWVRAAAAEAQFQAAFSRGAAAAEARDWPAAAEAFSEAVRLDPGSARARRRRGAAYFCQGEYDRALADLDEAVRLAPGDARAVYDRGVVYARTGDLDRALADFGEAVRLNPGYARAYLARAWVYSQKGDDARGMADRQRAVELDPALDKAGGPTL